MRCRAARPGDRPNRENRRPGRSGGAAGTLPAAIMLKGTALLLKRSLIERIGFLDARFFAYCENNNDSKRCAVAGFRAACATTARIYMTKTCRGEPGVSPTPSITRCATKYCSGGNMRAASRPGNTRGGTPARSSGYSLATGMEKRQRKHLQTGCGADCAASRVLGAVLSVASHAVLAARLFVATPPLSLALLEADPRAVLRALRHRPSEAG